MFHEFLLVGGWAFWGAVGLVIAIEIACMSMDNSEELGAPVFLALVSLALLVLFTDAFQGIRIASLVLVVIGYAIIGVIWSIKKWWTFVTNKRASAVDTWTKYSSDSRPSASSGRTLADYLKSERPSAADNKQRIVNWMLLWPFSMAWWVLTWPRRFFNWVYDQLSKTFDRITDRVWQS